MATPLEQFVHNVRTLSSQGNYRELVDLITKSSDILVKNGQHLDAVLECLQQHSLGMLAVLIVKLNLPPPQQQSNSNHTQPADYQEIVFTQVQEFITLCVAGQIKFAADSFADLCHMLTQQLIEAKAPQRGIELMAIAIRKLQTEESQLTLVHADLCQLSLLAKNFKTALNFLDMDITSIASQEGSVGGGPGGGGGGGAGGGGFEAKYFLLYFYYGGMIYAAVKRLERALYMFEVVVSTPAMAVSHIMLEAYKKFILISLILHGKVMLLPKYTSQVVTRFIKPLSQPYHELATVYATNNTQDLRQILTKYNDTFLRDSNLGLTKQVLSSLYKKNIQRLTKTFLTLSLSDVASRVQLSGPTEAEQYILHMIEDGEIFATINQKDGMVVFHDDPEKYNSPAMLCRLENQMGVCTELDRRIQRMEEEILTNPSYVKKCVGAVEEDISSAGHSTKMGYLM